MKKFLVLYHAPKSVMEKMKKKNPLDEYLDDLEMYEEGCGTGDMRGHT